MSSQPRAEGSARLARRGQIALGLIWLLDGALQFQPYMFSKSFITGVLLPSAAGQPGVIASPITWVAHQIEPHVALFNAFAATLQVLIGVGLLSRRTVKPALAASIAWGLGVWVMGEGFGMLATGSASPLTGAPGAALLYAVISVIVWPRPSSEAGPRSARTSAVGTARFAWAALWLGSAVLWLLPANNGASSIHDSIAAAPSGAGWLTSLLDHAARATAGHGTAIAVTLAVVSSAIGLAALSGRAIKPAVVVGVALAAVYWVVGQGFGGVLTGSATDVNAAPLVMLLGALLYGLESLRTHQPARAPARAHADARLAAVEA